MNLRERAAFETARKAMSADTMFLFNSAANIFKLAGLILDARLAADDAAAIAYWKQAVAVQDALEYDEPPPWYYPVRESLGGALLRSGRAVEAEAVFREDLKHNPRNGRTLFGLMESLKSQKKATAAEWVRREFESAWKQAKVSLRIEDL